MKTLLRKRELPRVVPSLAAFFVPRKTLLFGSARAGTLIGLLLAGLILGYIVLAVFLRTPRPLAPVRSDSMEPYLSVGSLVLVKNVHSTKIKEGNVIIFGVQRQGRIAYELVHRVVRIENDPAAGLIFWTKGDNREQMDSPGTPAVLVRGVAAFRAPFVGYIFMYLQSFSTWLFGALAVFAYLLYRYGGKMVVRLKQLDPRRADPVILKRLDRQEEVMQQFTEAITLLAQHIESHVRVIRGVGDSTDNLSHVVAKLDETVTELAGEVKKKKKRGILRWIWHLIF